MPTGLDLKLERIRLRVRGMDVAAAMGVHRSRVTHIERDAFPTPEAVARYRAALATCATSRREEVA